MIIDRYILREILYTLCAVLFVLLVIFMSNRFVRYLADATMGSVAGDLVLDMLLLKTLSASVIILPLGLFMAMLLAFSRLYKDNEMTALAACGVGMKTIYRSVLAFASLMAVLVGFVSFVAAPWAEEEFYQLRDAQQAELTLAGIAPGRFAEAGSGVFYFQRLSADGTTMHEVFGQQRRARDQILLTAERAYRRHDADGRQFLVFEEGFRYEGAPGAANFRIIEFGEHAMHIAPPDVPPAFRKQRALPTSDLIASRDLADIAELQWRISMPLSVLALALLAVPLSRTNPRQGKYAKLFVAILVYLIYNNLLGVANTWVARGVIAPQIGMWWVHLGILLGTWLLFVRQYGLNWALGGVFRKRALQ